MTTSHLSAPEPLLDSLTVADAMHQGILTCAPTAGMRDVAELLADNGVHSVVVSDLPDDDGSRALWGIVSAIDLMRGLGSPVPLTAGNLAALDIVTVAPEDPLLLAVQLMAEHDLTHLIVVRDGRPAGVLSTLDVARAAARA